MKTGLVFKAILLVVVFALGNALMVQPALEIHKHKPIAHADEKASDEAHCCFICHPAHRQWAAPTWLSGAYHLISSGSYLHKTFDLHLDPPIGSIFHPPQAF